LQVINSSPGDLAPVFDAMLEKAMRLCDAPAGFLLRHEDGKHSLAAGRGLSDDLTRFMTDMPQPQAQEAQMQILEGAPYVHVRDLKDSEAYRSGTALRRAVVDLGGLRTGLAVPLLKDGQVLGNFCLARYEVRPFADKQIALLQNFAAQAVIAMENARLITETREALEQQTATAEVLQVINSSPGHLAPVFDAILEKAHSLCGAAYGSLQVYDGEYFRAVAMRGLPEELANRLRQDYHGLDTPASRPLVEGANVVQISDLDQIDHPMPRRAVELAGMRTLLSVALRKDEMLLGLIVAGRKEVRPFADKEIALLENLAAQAVIAMENARLLTETREALEQQTATAEVLQVINSSPGDLAPVFDAMLDKALRLCGAAYGALRMWDGEHLTRVAWRAPQGFEDVSPKTVPAAPGSLAERFVRGETVISISDLVDDPNFQQSVGAQSLARRGNARTFLGVALRKDDRLLGTLVIYRQ
jgi:GAF domain-containing protein